MSFLAPFYLLLAGAAAVPLLIHLMRRRIGTRVEFPAARYLARAEREHSRSLRLRNLLLMLLRVLAILLVATAAARPVARWIGAGHGPTALAIVLDNSMSSSAVVAGQPVLSSLKAAARELLRQATTSDRLWLVTAEGRVRGGSVAAVGDDIDRVEPLSGAGDPRAAVARAAATARSAGIDARQVVVLTDGQRTTWQGAVDVGDVRTLVWVPEGEPPANRAVVLAEARPAHWTPRGAVVARFLASDSAAYRVTLGPPGAAPRSLARGTAAPGEDVVVHAAPPERGWLAGSVELEPDELPGDNVRHFAVWVGPAPGVAVSPGAGPFARSAVDVLRSSGRVADGHDVTIASADEAGSLPAVLIAPSDAVRLGAANRALERLGIPWRFGAPRHGTSGVGDAHGATMTDVTVSDRYALVPQGAADADTLATVGREPWVVAGPRYVLVASPLAPEATSLPVRAAFVPWLGELLTERLSGDAGHVVITAPGGRVSWPRGVQSLLAPDGATIALDAAGAEAIDAPARPGTYFLMRGGRPAGALVVDPEPEESVLDRETAASIAQRITGRHVSSATPTGAWAATAFRAASRRSLVEPVLLAALLLLAIESVIVSASPHRATV